MNSKKLSMRRLMQTFLVDLSTLSLFRPNIQLECRNQKHYVFMIYFQTEPTSQLPMGRRDGMFGVIRKYAQKIDLLRNPKFFTNFIYYSDA